ncbi:dihydroxyacetone kinase subunit DhaK [Azospirillum sp. ST 5-10]|uniref:dihydroxyacetone kinase subunit DhaK n=1 Tax=unclassified Azospirillum TaxID=2630922 RepID=UPI003F4A85B9
MTGAVLHARQDDKTTMKKLINDPSRYVDDSLDGLCSAFPTFARAGRQGRVVVRRAGAGPGKVGVVTGGGFGHLPVFAGYVGSGLLTACAVGEVFAGPPADVCADTIRVADGGAGVVCVLGNYGGDRMSFGLACDEVEFDGVATRTVIVADDVASAPAAEAHKRRGIAGMVFAFKAAGAMAESGAPLDEVARVAEAAASRTRSIGVALGACRIPGAAAPGFALGPDEMEIGMGIHGEPGIDRRALEPADAVTDAMLEHLLNDAPAAAGGRVAVLVNSLGATPLEELLIVHRRVRSRLEGAGLAIARSHVGHYVTSMEMAGCSISLLHCDDELERLLAAPTDCPFWRS